MNYIVNLTPAALDDIQSGLDYYNKHHRTSAADLHLKLITL